MGKGKGSKGPRPPKMPRGRSRVAQADAREVEVAIVIDESGSMEARRSQVISGVNEYLDSLRRDKRVRYVVSLCKFNTASWPIYTRRPIAEVPPLSRETYCPNGGTALVDAVADTINAVNAALGCCGGAARPVICAVVTDGEENSSKRWTSHGLRELIRARECAGNWTFVYLGADQNAWANAQQYGFGVGNTIRFDSHLYQPMFKCMAAATRTVTTNYLSGQGLAASNYATLGAFDTVGNLSEPADVVVSVVSAAPAPSIFSATVIRKMATA